MEQMQATLSPTMKRIRSVESSSVLLRTVADLGCPHRVVMAASKKLRFVRQRTDPAKNTDYVVLH